MDDNVKKFIRLTKARSESNTAAILTLFDQQLYGQVVSILRQELDSLIRVCYLLTINDLKVRMKLINSTISGSRWRLGTRILTDREMVSVASRYNHWAPEVYDFGNQFTHLTDYHDYKSQDPLKKLNPNQKSTIKNYLSSYHQFSKESEVNLENVIPYLPKVAEKISNNLSNYLRDLETDKNH